MIAEEISGWLQEVDPLIDEKILKQACLNKEKIPKHETLRSYSLCQRKEDCEKMMITKSNFNEKENSSQYIKSKIQKKQNSTIEELKKVMEFLAINEQYKYETHRIFDPNDSRFTFNCHKHKEQQHQQELRKNKFKLQLDIKDSYQPIPKSRRHLQPLTDTCQQQKIQSERSQLQAQQSAARTTETLESQNLTVTKFKFPKFIIQQSKNKQQHCKTDEVQIPKETATQTKKHIVHINRVFSNKDLLNPEAKFNTQTPKPKSQKKYTQNFLQQAASTSQDQFLKKAIINIQEAKEKQKQLKLLEVALKCKHIK